MFNGLFPLSAWQVLLVILGLTHITIVSVTVYLHRYSSHRAIELHPALRHFFRFWLWLTTGMNTLEWTAIHRKHHAKCETEEDPHSPVVLGINKVLWEGAELYAQAAKRQDILDQYGAGCPNDWLERHIYTPHKSLGIFFMLAINLVCFGAIGITIWAVQMIWIPFFAAGVINGLGHHSGYRNFECKDAATNLVPWGILIGGEELHNNHHTYPNSAKLSVKPWEFDLGYAWIRLFALLQLAKVNKLPPKAAIAPEKRIVDLDTLRALVSNRFQVMDRYRKQVITPVFRAEKERAEEARRKLFERTRKLLHREERLISDKARQRLHALTSDNPALSSIYQFRLRLQQIASRAGQGSQDMLDALKQWVVDAEESGIEALQEFARQLQRYVPAKVTA
jgi:fatty-acid desaturase